MQNTSPTNKWLSSKNLSIAIVLFTFASIAILYSTPSVAFALTALFIGIAVGVLSYIKIILNTVAEWPGYKTPQRIMGILVLLLLLPMIALMVGLLFPVLSLQ